MKTLYISDLDGTLLDASAALTPFTVQTINHLIERGLYFSVATARTSATVGHLLAGLRVNMPVVLMNGVALFDLAKGQYVEVCSIPKPSRVYLLEVLRSEGLDGFLYVVEENTLLTFYERAGTPHARQFMAEREARYGKRFTRIASFDQCVDNNVVYFSVADVKERLEPACERLKADPGLHVEFYRDIYCRDFWYLEICSSDASKYNAVMRLRARFGFDRVVSFGDNFNDLSMFAASDACFAVANAKEEVKARAGGVIGDNDHDGVARWLLENFQEGN